MTAIRAAADEAKIAELGAFAPHVEKPLNAHKYRRVFSVDSCADFFKNRSRLSLRKMGRLTPESMAKPKRRVFRSPFEAGRLLFWFSGGALSPPADPWLTALEAVAIFKRFREYNLACL